MILNTLTIIIILASLFVYYRQVVKAKKTEKGYEILASASQLTIIAFMLGLGILLVELNAFGLSRGRFVEHLLIYGAFVSLVTTFSIWYYSRLLKK